MTPVSRRTAFFGPVARAMLYVVYLAVVFVAFDVLCAQFVGKLSPHKTPLAAIRQPHAFYHHGLSPNARIIDTWGNLNAELFTNSLGMKDARSRPIARETSTYRVLALGDSFTEGQGYPFDATFSGVFQAWAGRNGFDLEVLNAGVASHSPRLYFYRLKYLLDYEKIRVDEINVFIDISDPQDEIGYRHYYPAEVDPTQTTVALIHNAIFYNSFVYQNFLREKFGGQVHHFLESAVRAFYRQFPPEQLATDPETGPDPKLSALIRQLDKSFATLNPGAPWEATDIWIKGYMTERYTWPSDPEIQQRWTNDGLVLATAYMDKLVALATQRGIPIRVIVYPMRNQIQDRNRFVEKYWREFSQRQGIAFFSLFDMFFDIEPGMAKDYFIPGDVHWNDLGHRLVGRGWFRDWCAGPQASAHFGGCRVQPPETPEGALAPAGGIASSTQDRVSAALDHDPLTWWSSAERGERVKGNAWLGARLAAPAAVSSIVLHQTWNRPFRQDHVLVEASADGKDWRSVLPEPVSTGQDRAAITLPLGTPPAAYWRLLAMGDNASGNPQAAWTPLDVEFFGAFVGPVEPVADDKPALPLIPAAPVASSSADLAGRVLDNDPQSWWNAQERGKDVKGRAWIGAQFAAPVRPSSILLRQTYNPPFRQDAVRVEASDDGTIWRPVLTHPVAAVTDETTILLPANVPPAAFWRLVAAADNATAFPQAPNATWTPLDVLFYGITAQNIQEEKPE